MHASGYLEMMPCYAGRPQTPPEEAERMQAEHGTSQAASGAEPQEIHMYDVLRPAASSEK